jgi:hypothetical protein
MSLPGNFWPLLRFLLFFVFWGKNYPENTYCEVSTLSDDKHLRDWLFICTFNDRFEKGKEDKVQALLLYWECEYWEKRYVSLLLSTAFYLYWHKNMLDIHLIHGVKPDSNGVLGLLIEFYISINNLFIICGCCRTLNSVALLWLINKMINNTLPPCLLSVFL